ncbi:MAG: ATP-binding cassette domain-containing protein [Pirellulales bacterium]
MTIQEGRRSGTLVVAADQVSAGYGERTIVRDFSCTILRGEKIGILGPNGAGKTTLLRTLLGQIEPTAGTIKVGTNLEIAYFDQLRRVLDEDKTVHENVGDGSDTIKFLDGTRHIIGYLQDFLFSPERARTPVKFLSGGERNRVLLAKLFAKPANVIVLDEPTNDLDAETLELLEARLVNFGGTVLVVSHDREFLNNVVDGVFAFEHGTIKEYVGGYDDWLRQRPAPLDETPKPETKSTKPTVSNADNEPKKRKLSYKEQKELDALPQTIHDLEAEIAARHAAAGDPAFYKQPPDRIAAAATELKTLEDKLETAFARWETLEAFV